jgi:tetratricopeptide (TPR) repeat protein
VVSLLRDLFDYLRIRGQWQEAFERLDAVVAAAGQVTEPRNLGWAHLHRGIIHLLHANYERAEDDFDHAGQIFSEKNDHVHQGIVQYQFGRLFCMRGDLCSARKHLETALELMGQEGPPRERIGALAQIAGIFATQGDTDQSRRYYDRALDLSQSAGETEEETRIHLALGDLARKAGDLPGAQTHLERAFELAKRLGDLLQSAFVQEELGYFHYYQGSYDEAETVFNEALATFQHLKYPRGLAQALHALGNLALAHQELDEAKKQYGAALKINQELGHKAAAAYNQYQLGVVASRAGQIDQAEECYKNALDAAQDEMLKDVVLQAAAWFQLSKLALMRNDIEHARQYTMRAKELAEQGKQRFTEGAALYQMSMMQAQEGQLEMSRDTLALAHAAFVALNAPEAEEVQKTLEAMEAGKGVQGVTKTGKKKHGVHDVDVVVDGGNITGMRLDEL